MTAKQFPHLLSTASIGNMQLKNRMVMSPMTTAYCNDDQTPSDRLIRYFEERARGGVGLITLELTTVDEVHRYMHRSMTLGNDKYIDHHRRIADAIHQHGCKVQPQISHTGPESVAPLFGGPQPVGPSVSVAPVWGWHSKPLEAEDLPEIARQYGEAARRAREAGYDGMELHAAHCYNLLASFLSPFRNKRTDDYSAFKADTRTRFITDVLAEIKSRAGQDFPVTLSISGYERTPGARAIDDTQRLAPLLVAAGVDCFRVSGGISDSLVTQIVVGSERAYGLNASHAEAIRNVVDVPVMVVGRIHTPETAEKILADGQADLIAFGRPLLADPWFASKVLAGRSREIRQCISCENCIDSMQTKDNLGCAVNPLSGRELELSLSPQRRSNKKPKKVLIVGGGPAGMEAARLATLQGHNVTLFEKNRRLGGALLLASTVHHDNQRFLDWLLAEMRRQSIDIRLGVDVTPALLQAEQADAVIVATGAKVLTPAIEGVEESSILTGALMRQIVSGSLSQAEAHRLSGWQRKLVTKLVPVLQKLVTPALLRQLSRWWMPLGHEVVIVGADIAAVELAEFLAQRGRRVHIVDSGNKIMPEVGKKRRNEHMDRLDLLCVTVNTGVEIRRIASNALVFRVGNGDRTIYGDSIIVAGEVVADTTLADSLREAGMTVYAIGDCTGLGLIAKATQTAAEAVEQLA